MADEFGAEVAFICLFNLGRGEAALDHLALAPVHFSGPSFSFWEHPLVLPGVFASNLADVAADEFGFLQHSRRLMHREADVGLPEFSLVFLTNPHLIVVHQIYNEILYLRLLQGLQHLLEVLISELVGNQPCELLDDCFVLV